MKQKRKSTDGLGVIIWWYDNGWRIVRSPFPYAWHVETSPGHCPFEYRDGFGSKRAAESWLRNELRTR